MKACYHLLAVALLLTAVAPPALAQGRPGAGRPGGREEAKKPEPPPRPTEPMLVELHKEFVSKAEKLAAEFETKKQHDKAREVYESLLRLLPEYPAAAQGLQRTMTAQASKDRMTVEVQAAKAWQDTGVTVIAGNPVHIEAQGVWQIGLVTGPRGVEIPKEARFKGNLTFEIGALIGVILDGGNPDDSEPFLIGEGKEFIAESTGRLFLRIYDWDPSDNRGKMTVLIQSTFAK
ncbi:MAG: hypothetical protein J5I93_08045 [Pirellulaceae bacterium]|nr:hypothetical protein [Pirellulaceae bacterium]